MPRPSGSPVVRFIWRDLLFLHWPVPAAALRSLVPDPLELDTYEGKAWLGLVPFSMTGIRMRGVAVPSMHRFHECNVRTYVRCGGEPAVWFLSLDAVSRIAVWGARRFWHLNYVHSSIDLEREGDEVRYALERRVDRSVRLRCTWREGARRPEAEPGSLAHFLTERYQLATVDRRGRVRRGRIDHVPWPLREAEVMELDENLVRANGVELPDEAPLAWSVSEIVAEAWGLEVV